METNPGVLAKLGYEHMDLPPLKRDLRQPLYIFLKCDTRTSDIDVLLSAVMKANRIAFVCSSTGGRKSDACRCRVRVLNK